MAVAIAGGATSSPLQGQVEPLPTPSPQVQLPDTTPGAAGGVSPGQAFLRAVLIPGWGHASIGSYTRGGFYFVAETTTAWMLFKTRRRLAAARARADFRDGLVRDRLEAQGVTETEEIDAALEEDEVLVDLNNLVTAREQQQEDWVALGVFLLFLSGADAFVSAHLSDFPTPLEVNATPVAEGRVELSLGLKLGGR